MHGAARASIPDACSAQADGLETLAVQRLKSAAGKLADAVAVPMVRFLVHTTRRNGFERKRSTRIVSNCVQNHPLYVSKTDNANSSLLLPGTSSNLLRPPPSFSYLRHGSWLGNVAIGNVLPLKCNCATCN
ncbi:hypothetical protein [Comamonas endophytica]|uniref:Uncharacterized protein n=1 Tax=Comamonas endophytica TaxID=2949090 RepID=A0ABY6GAB0_9BURK|nr:MULTISPECIES: hypothetical protein [unclassified Acidovorax]MCD2514009.1 hypothetical protein [Acidovorax sp. D4N7]UYG52001.1 hypothetical protein M9799_01780 [Acidovorax sp. 5MLIR]